MDSVIALFVLLLEVLNPSSSFVRDSACESSSKNQHQISQESRYTETVASDNDAMSFLDEDYFSPSEEAEGAVMYVVLVEHRELGLLSGLSTKKLLRNFYRFDPRIVLIRPPALSAA